jgi:exodeoxyribonuclease V alpha subunit
LKKLYRREESSNITLLAHDIINDSVSMDLFNGSDDLSFIECDSAGLKGKLLEVVSSYIDCSYDSFQVLAPVYKGDNGIDDLNYFLQDIFNPKDVSKNEMVLDGVLYRECDKVLQLVNNVDDNVFNGDIGCVRLIKKKDKQVYIDFDNNMVKYTPTNYGNVKLGYAISIHKAQGSEFDYVVIPVLNKYNNMLYRKLIYTGITRAKKRLILIGEVSAFVKSVHNTREDNRRTCLKNFIVSCIE